MNGKGLEALKSHAPTIRKAIQVDGDHTINPITSACEWQSSMSLSRSGKWYLYHVVILALV
jgi:hypothetical protein